MNRAAGSTTGWKVVIQQIGSEKTTEEFWDKVVLCTGVSPAVSSRAYALSLAARPST